MVLQESGEMYLETIYNPRAEKPLCPFHRCCGISTMRIANKVYSADHGRMS